MAQTKESQSKITPDIALELLKAGNERFLANQSQQGNLPLQVQTTAGGQYPFAVVLSCIDSRVPSEIVFDQGIGDIFSARVAGNIVNNDLLGSIEYACKVAGSKLVLVLGHTACGAVKGACDGVELGHITELVNKIKPAVIATKESSGLDPNTTEFKDAVVRKNVELTIENIKNDSAVLIEMLNNGEISIAGAIYDVGSGGVEFIN